jgi:hypothetical protein
MTVFDGLDPEQAAPIDLSTVLSPQWLGAALSCGRAQPVSVQSVHVVEVLGPSATKVRLVAECDFGAGPPTPTALCLKGFFGADVHGYLKSGVQRTEALFYRECAPLLGVRVPRCVYAGIDPRTQAGVIVMEDLIARGGRFHSVLQPYGVTEAQASLDQLARLHAGSQAREAHRRPWVTSRLAALAAYDQVPASRLTELMQGPRGDGLPGVLRDGERMYAAMRALARLDPQRASVLVHGDAHAGNVFVLPEGTGWVDWQLLQRGHWSLDVAYHVAAVLTPAQRALHERDLLQYYLDRVQAHSGSAPNLTAAWADYCAAFAYGYFLWGITQRVAPEVIREFVVRLGSAVADHGSFEHLGV